jgi:hypothetical protein
MKIDPKKLELLSKWYLRFNGYFTIESFYIHAADDPTRISKETVSNYTEIDLLGIRMPFNSEVTGELAIKNDSSLVLNGKLDLVIAECKSGNEGGLNDFWKNPDIQRIEYIIRFVGLFNDNNLIAKVSESLATNLNYEDNNVRIRLLLISKIKPTKYWIDRNLEYKLLSDIIDFLLMRGTCWVDSSIGQKSCHQQWDKMIKEIFHIINNGNTDTETKKQELIQVLR